MAPGFGENFNWASENTSAYVEESTAFVTNVSASNLKHFDLLGIVNFAPDCTYCFLECYHYHL